MPQPLMPQEFSSLQKDVVRSEGRPSCSSVQQALSLLHRFDYQSTAPTGAVLFCSHGLQTVPRAGPPTQTSEACVLGRGGAREHSARLPQANASAADFATTKGRTSRTPVLQALNCTFYTAKALKTPELSQFRGFSFCITKTMGYAHGSKKAAPMSSSAASESLPCVRGGG